MRALAWDGSAVSSGLVTTLMVYAGPATADAAVTRTGGTPLVPDGFGWPACRSCEGAMTFLAQVMPVGLAPGGRQGVLSVFMCQNDPGLCDEWDPVSGGNQALLFPVAGLRPAVVPDGPGTTLGEVSAVEYVTVEEDYSRARHAWAGREGRPVSDVLGQLGGRPWWLQHDETPSCSGCAAEMSFAVQLAEGHDYRTSMNFGGGYGYGFTCGLCNAAAFLWQR
jgi:hypothetical protein